jgi:hypothetical protein
VALLQIDEPGPERIGEGLDRVVIPSDRVEPEGAGPAVVVHVPHRRLEPHALVSTAIAHEREQHIVAVLEDVRGDLEDRADLALDRIAAAVDGGRDALDDDGAAGCLDRPGAHDQITRPG